LGNCEMQSLSGCSRRVTVTLRRELHMLWQLINGGDDDDDDDDD